MRFSDMIDNSPKSRYCDTYLFRLLRRLAMEGGKQRDVAIAAAVKLGWDLRMPWEKDV